MSKAAVVYLVMIVSLVGGLWAILAVGAHLSAPEDLAGRWQLSPTRTVAVEQSGRFFQLAFAPGDGRPVHLRIVETAPNHLLLRGGNCSVAIDGPPGDDKTILVTGPAPGRYAAHRTAHTFAPAAAAVTAPATRPTTREGH